MILWKHQDSDMKKIPFNSGGTILIIRMVPQLSHAKLYGFEVAWQVEGTIMNLGEEASFPNVVRQHPDTSRLLDSLTIVMMPYHFLSCLIGCETPLDGSGHMPLVTPRFFMSAQDVNWCQKNHKIDVCFSCIYVQWSCATITILKNGSNKCI